MKELKAYIRQDKMDDVVRGLRTQGARALTMVRVVPIGSEIEPEFVDISSATPIEHYTPMLKLELVCDDEHASAFAETIRERAHTGKPGDGVIFISDVERALHIRSGSTDEAAL